jgi:tRNA-Thr(GGU) m(6)t(6)A37 methyltransferase TsaA
MNSKKKLPSMRSKDNVIALKNLDVNQKGDEIKGVSPVGFVCSPYRRIKDIPIKRGISTIRILDQYVPGLGGLDSSSHVIVIGYLHIADRQALKATPRPEEVGAKLRGIFSVRSPARPNPLAYTVVKLLEVTDGEVTVEGLDFIDGTPVIDIKPYSPGWDSIHTATRLRRFPLHEMNPSKALDLLLRDAINFSGELDGEGMMMVAMVFLLATQYRIDPREPNLRMEINRSGSALDALIGACGATFGSGRIKVVDLVEDCLVCRFYWKGCILTMKASEEKGVSQSLTPEEAEGLIKISKREIVKES